MPRDHYFEEEDNLMSFDDENMEEGDFGDDDEDVVGGLDEESGGMDLGTDDEDEI